jgi:hypothetical protein
VSLEFLTPAELYTLTKRRKYKSQIKKLRALGYVARLDGDGHPLVLRAHVEAKFGITQSSEREKAAPNWDALDAKNTTH